MGDLGRVDAICKRGTVSCRCNGVDCTVRTDIVSSGLEFQRVVCCGGFDSDRTGDDRRINSERDLTCAVFIRTKSVVAQLFGIQAAKLVSRNICPNVGEFLAVIVELVTCRGDALRRVGVASHIGLLFITDWIQIAKNQLVVV